MNSFSDIVGRKQTQDADTDSPFVLRKVESSRAIAARLTPHASDTEPEDEQQTSDPLILGLIERLPKPRLVVRGALRIVSGGSAPQTVFSISSTARTTKVRRKSRLWSSSLNALAPAAYRQTCNWVS